MKRLILEIGHVLLVFFLICLIVLCFGAVGNMLYRELVMSNEEIEAECLKNPRFGKVCQSIFLSELVKRGDI